MQITLSDKLKDKPNYDVSPFPTGRVSTDHMFMMDYSGEKGWHNSRIIPYAPLDLDPLTNSLHYGQLIFEGMKAYKDPDGRPLLFRPFENAERLNLSAKRLCMPEIDPKITVEAIAKLVEVEKSWIPDDPKSLYIRPFMMAMDPTINVIIPDTYLFAIIVSPFGYLYGGLSPIHILAQENYIRAAKGGTGFAKCAGNYAGAFLAMKEAKEAGYDQVLWLDAVEHKYIEEASTMNVFFLMGDTIVTPAVSDSILSGITRKSIIEILKDWGMKVEERKLSIEEIEGAKEVFCTGTAAVITPIGEITYKGKKMTFNNKQVGELTSKVHDELSGIQRGTRPDTRGWTYKI